MTSPDLDTPRAGLIRRDVRLPAHHDTLIANMAESFGLTTSDVTRLALERGLMVLARDGVQPMDSYAGMTLVPRLVSRDRSE